MIGKRPVTRFSAYVVLVSLLSLVLESVAQMLGQFMAQLFVQFLVLPVMFPLVLLGVVFDSLGDLAGYLDVDCGSFAAFLFRGLASGLSWGGCIAFPLDMYRRTKQKKYKFFMIAFGIYAVLVLVGEAALLFMLSNSGWTD